MRFSDLTPGYEFPAAEFVLDAATVARYLAATEDDNAIYWRDGAVHMVPPLGVAALAFRDIAQRVALEPGSLHTGQELTFHRPVMAGERLTTQARVATHSKRRGFTALIVELAAIAAAGAPALSGRMTLMVAGPEVMHHGMTGAGAVGAETDAGTMAAPAVTVGPASAPVAFSPTRYGALSPAEMVPGVELGTLTRTITQQRIDRYAGASGDYNPIHIDPRFAAGSPFGGTVAHGMLLLSYVSCLLTRAAGLAWSGSGALKVKFRNPAPEGAMVTARGQVERLEDDAYGVQYAVCAVRLENAAGEALITGEARVPLLIAESMI